MPGRQCSNGANNAGTGSIGRPDFYSPKEKRIARAMRAMVFFGLVADMYGYFLWIEMQTFSMFLLCFYISICSLLKLEYAFKEEKRLLVVTAYIEYLCVYAFILPFSSDYEWFIYAYCMSMFIYIYSRWGLSYVAVYSHR